MSDRTTDPQAMVAAALEQAATIEVTGEPSITPITRHAIRALIDQPARAALDRAKEEAFRAGFKAGYSAGYHSDNPH